MTAVTKPLGLESKPISLFGILLGLGCFALVLLFFRPEGADPAVTKMAAVVVLMAIWWVLEPVPFAVTALLPFVLFPILGLQSGANFAVSSAGPEPGNRPAHPPSHRQVDCQCAVGDHPPFWWRLRYGSRVSGLGAVGVGGSDLLQ